MDTVDFANLDPAFQARLAEYDEVLPLRNQHGNNHRWQYAKARKGTDWYFLKYACRDDERYGLERERKWSNFMTYVATEYPSAGLVEPAVVSIEHDVAIFRYIDTPLAADETEASEWRRCMHRYAQMLVTLDKAALAWSGDDITDREQRTDNVAEIWQKWIQGSGAYIERLDEALSFVSQAIPTLRQVMQHGDLQPWQIFDLGDTWMIYDGERSGADLLRYNDLAYGYGRLYTKLHSPDGARDLLRYFLDESGTDRVVFWREFQPVMVGRAIGMLSDAWHDKPTNDYVQLAEELLNFALDNPQRLV